MAPIIFSMGRGHLFTVLKIAVGIALIVVLIHITPIKEVGRTLKNANIYYLLVSAGLYLAALLVGPLRWSGLLSAKGIHLPLRRIISYFFIGFFFNNFLPTIVGGDVARATYAGLESGKKAEAVAATVVDRAVGFLALTVIVLFITLGSSHFGLDREIFVVPVVIIVLLTAGVSLFFNNAVFNKLTAALGRIRFFNLGERVADVYGSIYSYKKDKSRCLLAFLLSLCLQSGFIVANYTLGHSVGIRISPFYYFLFIPIIAFMSMVPLTPNAIGIRESGYLLLFCQVGVTRSQAMSLSVLNLSLVLLSSLIGGVIFLLYRGKLKL
jgi:uncharacterized protein (TIRG00374 family)